jgi:hypothetical protein
LEPIEVTEAEAQKFKIQHGDKCDIRAGEGDQWFFKGIQVQSNCRWSDPDWVARRSLLGSHILRDICESEKVVRVYAFNRPQKRASLAQRQGDVLRDLAASKATLEMTSHERSDAEETGRTTTRRHRSCSV